MREIKFRVWDTENKHWFPKDRNEEWVNLMPDGDVVWGEVDGDPQLGEGRFEIMQFTCLKDKNGKEIWEGDIIKAIHKDRPWSKSKRKKEFHCAVIFKDGAFNYEWPKDYGDYRVGQNLEQTEVIGNIYETPELLTGQAENAREAAQESAGLDSLDRGAR